MKTNKSPYDYEGEARRILLEGMVMYAEGISIEGGPENKKPFHVGTRDMFYFNKLIDSARSELEIFCGCYQPGDDEDNIISLRITGAFLIKEYLPKEYQTNP